MTSERRDSRAAAQGGGGGTLQVDGAAVRVGGADVRTLLDALRSLGKSSVVPRGCHDGQCGTCRVLLDGKLTSACTVPWDEVPPDAVVETFESLGGSRAARRALAAFETERPTRCRLCVPSLGVTAVALARAQHEEHDGSSRAAAVEEALAAATCACTGRGSLRRALLR